MSRLQVDQAGPMLTVQDLGRPGLFDRGVSGAGPMDPPAFEIANALVGNHRDAAALEFAVFGGRFSVDYPVRIAVTGGALEIRIDDRLCRPWESYVLRPGQSLSLGALRGAVWGYLAISGGIDTPPVLDSRSTHLRSGLGGLEGRRLAAGDNLPLGVSSPKPLRALAQGLPRGLGPILVIPGPQADHFAPRIWDLFLTSDFVVGPSRDRMAQVLDGPLLVAEGGHDIVSDGTVAGSIQVPASGRPIVLMAERQTTGGYPKIATIASADLPRLAQMPTGSRIRFRRISRDDAETLLIDSRRALAACLADLPVKTEG
ncbi:biotin-dependent carboxyltransferase family protein [Rhizobium sp. YIM 134829]|uniref:5-oxoprolinase subunit C family protein n=1 Tax=Rhizobium sp. YIM 134829 TaxID=3390453 RepID=UPI00397849A4